MKTYYQNPAKPPTSGDVHKHVQGRFYPADGEDSVLNIQVLTRGQKCERKVIYVQDVFPPVLLKRNYPRRVIVTVKEKRSRHSSKYPLARFLLFYDTASTSTYNKWLSENDFQLWRTSILALKFSRKAITNDWLSGKTLRGQDVVDWDESLNDWADEAVKLLAAKVQPCYDASGQVQAAKLPTRFTIYE